MIQTWYIWGFFFLCLIGYGLVSVTQPKRKRAARFADREDLSLDQIFDAFYKDSRIPKELFFDLWQEAARALYVPPGKLRPTDAFDKELGSVGSFPLADVNEDFLSSMLKRLREIDQHAKARDLNGIKSLNDYIYFFGRREQAISGD